MEALWPDEDPARLSNRLSVALSTVRTVLDPERRYASDRFVQADKHIVGLAHVPVDVEEFLAAAAAGLDRFTSGERAEALSLLASAETAYTGDFLEDDPYEDWAVSLREEARAVYLAVARTLARSAAAAGDARSGRPLPPQGAGARRLRRGGPPGAGGHAGSGRPPRRGAPSLPDLRPEDGRAGGRANAIPVGEPPNARDGQRRLQGTLRPR